MSDSPTKENQNPSAKTASKKRTHIPVDGYKIEDLRTMSLDELVAVAAQLEVENPNELKRQDLMFEILKSQISRGGFMLFTGMLEIATDG